MILFVALVSLLTGIGVGWYLRRINAWCPRCGDSLTCPACGGRPTWSSPGTTRRPARRSVR